MPTLLEAEPSSDPGGDWLWINSSSNSHTTPVGARGRGRVTARRESGVPWERGWEMVAANQCMRVLVCWCVRFDEQTR